MQARLKKYLILVGFMVSLFSSNVFALGLGDIAVNSELNETLDSTIELLELDGVAAEDISVLMGSQADFNLVDLERLDLVDDIRFEVQTFSNNEGRIQLRTDNGISEPYLSFILNVSWPGGRLLREYTVLIDLPTFTEGLGNPAPAPATPQISRDSSTYVIQENDTLWDIALNTREDSSISVHQMMLGLQRANSNAFIENNINRIRAGEVLRIPSREELLSLSQQQAVSQVALQNQQVLGDVGSQPVAANTSNNTTSTVSEEGDELSVLTGNTGASLGNTIADLESELALSAESLDRARIENEELNGRLADLESEVEILQNIIAIEDERIAQLQSDLAAQAEAATQALAEAQEAANAALAIAEANVEPVDNSLMGKINAIFTNTYILMAVLWSLVVLLIIFLVWLSRRANETDDDEFVPSIEDEASEEEVNAESDEDESSEEEFDDFEDFSIDDEDEHEYGSKVEEEPLFSEDIAEDDSTLTSDEDAEEDTEEETEEFSANEVSEGIELEDIELEDTDSEEVEIEDEDASEEAVDFSMDEFIASEEKAEPEVSEEPAFEIELDEPEEAEVEIEESEEDEPEVYDFGVLDEDLAVANGDNNTPEIELETEEESVESLEFSVSEQPEVEIEAVAEVEVSEDLEVLDFSFDESSTETTTAEPAESNEEKEEIETAEFIDFGNIDENDNSFDDSEIVIDDTGTEDEDILESITDDKDDSSTKLNLAVAYQSMGDMEGAQEILKEVIRDGSADKAAEAQALLDKWNDA